MSCAPASVLRLANTAVSSKEQMSKRTRMTVSPLRVVRQPRNLPTGCRLRLFGCRRVNDRFHLGDAIRRETALPSVLPNQLFIRRDIDAVDSITRYVALDPLNR